MLDASEMERLVSLSRREAVTAAWIGGMLARGETRPDWCRMAESADSELLAAHAFDSFSLDAEPGEVPTFVHLTGHANELVAVELLRHDLGALGATEVEARLQVAVDAAPDLRALRESQQRVLQAAGFAIELDRVRVIRRAGTPVRRPDDRLTFRPVAALSDAGLVEIFAAVGDGSLDHSMITGRAQLGRRGEAELRLRQAVRRTGEDDWFAVGFDHDGEPVGYVQSALVDTDRPILAEIGVVASQRGRHYVDELLAYGTAILIDNEHPEIDSTTDDANHPMRAAFIRGGYTEFATQRDFRWVA
jgi:RimJ/RimL family protein N-acetyltransferase